MALRTCAQCGQTYNPRYMRYCARCGEGLPDERGRKPKRGPMDGGGARGGISTRKRTPPPLPPPEATAAGAALQEWTPSQSVLDIVLEYRNQLNEHPDDHATRYALGLAYCLARRWGPAEEHLAIVTEAQPDFAEAFARLAVCRERMGDPSGGCEAAQRARDLEPKNARYFALLQRLAESA